MCWFHVVNDFCLRGKGRRFWVSGSQFSAWRSPKRLYKGEFRQLSALEIRNQPVPTLQFRNQKIKPVPIRNLEPETRAQRLLMYPSSSLALSKPSFLTNLWRLRQMLLSAMPSIPAIWRVSNPILRRRRRRVSAAVRSGWRC